MVDANVEGITQAEVACAEGDLGVENVEIEVGDEMSKCIWVCGGNVEE